MKIRFAELPLRHMFMLIYNFLCCAKCSCACQDIQSVSRSGKCYQESAINLVVPSSVFVLLKLVLLVLVLAVAVVVGRALAVEQWRLGAGGEERNIISVVT